MAQSLIASIYGINANAIGTNQGKSFGFPTQSIVIRAADSPIPSFNGVSCPSVIQLLPTGLNQPSINYASPVAVATLVAAANA